MHSVAVDMGMELRQGNGTDIANSINLSLAPKHNFNSLPLYINLHLSHVYRRKHLEIILLYRRKHLEIILLYRRRHLKLFYICTFGLNPLLLYVLLNLADFFCIWHLSNNKSTNPYYLQPISLVRSVLLVQAILIWIWILLLTLLWIWIWLFTFIRIRICLLATDPDPYCFNEVMYNNTGITIHRQTDFHPDDRNP